MAIINIFYGAFEKTHETIIIEENKAIKDCVEVDFTNSLIFVNGYRKDESFILKNKDVCTIRLFPSGPAVAVVAIIVVAVVVADNVVRQLTGKGILGWIKEGIRRWLAGDVDDGPAGPESLKGVPQLRGAKNKSGFDQPYPFVMGKHLFTPYYVGRPYTTIGGVDGEDQYFHALYLIGYSELKITKIKIGEIDLCSNEADVRNGFLAIDGQFQGNNPKIELQQGENEVSLYPQKVIEEQLSVELLNAGGQPLNVTRFSAQNPQKVQVEFTINGLLSYNDEGTKINASVSILLEWRESGTAEWKEFGPIIGCQYYAARTSSFVRSKSQVMRFIAEKTFSYDEIMNVPGRTIEIHVVRTSSQSLDGRTSDTVYLSAVRTWCFDYRASIDANELIPQAPIIAKDRNKTCRMGFAIKAGEYLSGMIDSVNCIAQSCCRTWNGSGWGSSQIPTQNPASIALKALQSPMLGQKAYPDEKIDLDSFGTFYEYCNAKGFTCNGILTSQKKLEDLLHAILTTSRALILLRGSKYGILIDRPRLYPVAIINNQNALLDIKNQKTFGDLPDGFKIRFIDESDGYQENELYAMRDGPGSLTDMSVIESVEMPFVTNREQVYKNGMYQLACLYLRPEIWNRKLDVYGNLIEIGDLVEIQDDTILTGIGEGAEITGFDITGNYIVKIITDGLFEVTEETNRYGLKILQFDGTNMRSIRTAEVIITETGIHNVFELVEPISLSDRPAPSIGDIVSFGIFDRITIDALCLGKKDNGDGTFEITMVPYDERIYSADSGEMPVFDSKVTAPVQSQPSAGYPKDIYEKIDQIFTDNSKRPTYKEIVEGFTQAGATVVPSQLSLSAVGGFRFITLSWASQKSLSNLKEYQLQVSENTVDWHALRFDGIDWKGDADDHFSTVSSLVIHPNIPPAGTPEAPEGRMLYYRARQCTMLDKYSEWSAVVGAQTTLADTGDYAANSISSNALKAAELFALFAHIGHTLIIDPATGISSENQTWAEGDTRAILNSKEITFQYFIKLLNAGAWQNMARLGLEGVGASQFFSPGKMFITNDDMIGRRAKEYDIGMPYLSSASRVVHYDTDMLDQNGQALFSMSGNGALVGDSDGMALALKATAPYATDSKALYGNFSLQTDIIASSPFTVDFWMLYKWNEEQILFSIGNDVEQIIIEVINDEPYLNDHETESVWLNDRGADGIWLNEIKLSHARVAHYLNGVWEYIIIEEDGNPGLITNKWYHIGIIHTNSQIQVVINNKVFPFGSQPIASVLVNINPQFGQVDGEHSLMLVDEVLIDPSVAENLAVFYQNTGAKRPWGKLDDQYPWFVLNVKDPQYFKTNIFRSADFEDAVMEIINSQGVS
jgi:hypothetical protein